VAELLKFKIRYGRPHVLVQWTSRDASGDTWEPLENLSDQLRRSHGGRTAIAAAFERGVTGRSLPRPASRPPLAAGPAPPPFPRQGSPSTPRPRRTFSGAALVGRQLPL
jgi:hypothetical protein